MASSIFFVGVSLITFALTFGIIFEFMPIILGTVFGVIGNLLNTMHIDAGWLSVYNDTNSLAQYIVPLVMGCLMVLLVLKVLMAAGVRGGD